MIAIALYAPSSPQRLVDCARVVYSSGVADTLVVVKPVGMAAQVGLAEVSKLAYRSGKKLVILSQLDEVREVLDIDETLYLVHDDSAHEIAPVIMELGMDKRICIVIQGGETSIPKHEMSKGIPVKHSIPAMDPVPVADVALVVAELMKLFQERRDASIR